MDTDTGSSCASLAPSATDTTSGPWDPRLVLYLLALRRYTIKSQSELSPSEP